jgi:hypothetical protein
MERVIETRRGDHKEVGLREDKEGEEGEGRVACRAHSPRDGYVQCMQHVHHIPPVPIPVAVNSRGRRV